MMGKKICIKEDLKSELTFFFCHYGIKRMEKKGVKNDFCQVIKLFLFVCFVKIIKYFDTLIKYLALLFTNYLNANSRHC